MRRRLLKHWPLVLAGLLALLCLFSVWRLHAVSSLLTSQQAAERWQGESERSFAQVSAFTPRGEEMTLEQMMTFRKAMAQKLKDASYDLEKETGLYSDAWSYTGMVKVSAGRRSGEVQAVAVGGRFFDFHPLRLVSGSYLSPSDIMEDRVLLDRETAWLLFGGMDLTGMSFSLNGTPVVVAGVYSHETDAFSKKASEGAMRIYMHYELYEKLFPGKVGVGCYEFVMADPVKGFAPPAPRRSSPSSPRNWWKTAPALRSPGSGKSCEAAWSAPCASPRRPTRTGKTPPAPRRTGPPCGWARRSSALSSR